ESRIVELQRQERGRQPAGHADLEARQRSSAGRPRHLFLGLARDEDRTVLIAHARTVRQQRIAIGEMRGRMKRDGGDTAATVTRRAVQRLDVRQDLVDLDAVRTDGVARQTIEHECVIGIRAMRDGDLHWQSWWYGRSLLEPCRAACGPRS